MAENKMEALAKLFDVELYEEFEIETQGTTAPYRYRFSKYGLEYFDTRDAAWVSDESTIFELLINSDLYKVKKQPWKPQMDETYWYPYITSDNKLMACPTTWSGGFMDYAFFECALVYRTKDSCEANMEADYERMTWKKWQW